MEQIDTVSYKVIQGENVKLTVTAHTIDEEIAVSLDGGTVNPASVNPAIFNFQITKSNGAQFLVVDCHFKAADDANAFYQFSLEGSDGGGQFDASSVRKDDFIKRITYQFTLPKSK